jgi:hypothetical protein
MFQTENVQLFFSSISFLLALARYLQTSTKRYSLSQHTLRQYLPPSDLLPLVEERIVDRQDNRRAHSRPAGSRNDGVLEPNADIPGQMPQAVHAVEEEGHCNGEFGGGLGPQRPCGDRSDQGLALEVPSERRGCEVCDAEDVETTAEDDGGETVEAGGVPGDLRLVDGKMRGDGTTEALLGEDLLAGLLADRVGQSGTLSASRVLGSVLMG